MLKQSIILSAFFLISLYASCPSSYPYSPKNGVFSGGSWEYFCDDWKLAQPGTGVISFQARGNDLYVGVFDTADTKSFTYALIISGWSNSLIKIYSSGSFSKPLASSSYSISETDQANNFRVVFNKSSSSITVYINNDQVFNYIDASYKASNSQFVSFSQFSSNVKIYKNCPNYPYSPRNGVYSGDTWEYFCDDWNLAKPGTGEVAFQASGSDIYVGFFDTNNTKSFTYALILSWHNSETRLFRSGSFKKVVSSASSSVDSTDASNSYKVVLDENSKTITVFVNSKQVFKYVDSTYLASNSKYVSFSQYFSSVSITKNCPDFPYSPRNGVFTGSYWEYFCKQWRLPSNGTGIVNFQAKGNDWYLGFFDQENVKTFKYAIIFGGWSNTALGLYENDFSTSLVSAKVAIKNTDQYNNYSVSVNQATQTISIAMNGIWVLSYYDVSYSGGNSSWFSFSQYSSNVAVRNITVEYFCGQDPSKFAIFAEKKKIEENKIFLKNKLMN